MLIAAAAVLSFLPASSGTTLHAGETAVQAPPSPVAQEPMDPFAGLLENGAVEIRKTGPSCQFIKIPLPPGVQIEEIPGLDAP